MESEGDIVEYFFDVVVVLFFFWVFVIEVGSKHYAIFLRLFSELVV